MKFICELRKTNSTNEKQRLLRLYALDAFSQEILERCYNPYKTYGIKFAYVQDDFGDMDMQGIHGMREILDKLETRELSGNEASDVVEAYAQEYGDLIKLVCNKDLKCGISATTINKVFPGMIPQFKVQLAKEVPLKDSMFPMIAQTKYDGVRLLSIKDECGDVKLYTRNGQVVPIPVLQQELEKAQQPSTVLDGELISVDGKRTTISGFVNSRMKGGMAPMPKLLFQVFDYLPLSDFQRGKCDVPYDMRRSELYDVAYAAAWDCFELIATTPSKLVKSSNEADELFAEHLAKGEEGIILKPLKHLYTFKRSKDWIKLKDIRTADLRCVGHEEGTGKYEGMIGALLCEGTVDGRFVRVRVGSGLSDEDRSKHIDAYILKTIEVKYNTVIENSATGGWSLFLPRFVTVRFDK